MSGMVYLMEDMCGLNHVKFGHRTKDRFQDVIEEITNEYGTLCRCIAGYDLGTNTPDDTEKTVSQIRLIFRAAAGVLAEEQPEYYEISCDRALTILKAVAALRGDSEEAIHEIKCGGQNTVTWYIENNGEAKLIPEEVLKYKIENNEISGDTLVVNEEIGNWIPLKETQFWAQIRQGKENRINLDDFNHTQNQQAVIKNEKAKVLRLILIVMFIIGQLFVFQIGPFSPSYYVAKLPNYNAGTIKVDGYMHKSKSCCQKVADAFGATVIKVKPHNKAGTNEYGQTVKYEDAFYYCPLCN